MKTANERTTLPHFGHRPEDHPEAGKRAPRPDPLLVALIAIVAVALLIAATIAVLSTT